MEHENHYDLMASGIWSLAFGALAGFMVWGQHGKGVAFIAFAVVATLVKVQFDVQEIRRHAAAQRAILERIADHLTANRR